MGMMLALEQGQLLAQLHGKELTNLPPEGITSRNAKALITSLQLSERQLQPTPGVKRLWLWARTRADQRADKLVHDMEARYQLLAREVQRLGAQPWRPEQHAQRQLGQLLAEW